MTANRVNLVNEDDARRVLFGLLEHVAHTGRTHTNKHFHEVGTGNGEERHVGLACHGFTQKRLTGTRRANQQHAAWNAATKALEFLRITQKLDNFLQIFLGFINARHIVKHGRALAPRSATWPSTCQSPWLCRRPASGA